MFVTSPSVNLRTVTASFRPTLARDLARVRDDDHVVVAASDEFDRGARESLLLAVADHLHDLTSVLAAPTPPDRPRPTARRDRRSTPRWRGRLLAMLRIRAGPSRSAIPSCRSSVPVRRRERDP